MQYKILESTDSFWLTTEIEKAIKEWWEPQGWISVVLLESGFERYAQAMIKK